MLNCTLYDGAKIYYRNIKIRKIYRIKHSIAFAFANYQPSNQLKEFDGYSRKLPL